MKPSYTNDQLISALNAWTEPETFPKDDGTLYLPESRLTTYVMNPAILCCALFGSSKGLKIKGEDGKNKFVKSYIERTFSTTNGAVIEYQGKQLGQEDLTVLLGLLHLRRGMATSCEIEFFPATFCSKIGWSDSDHNIKRLKSCLLRLRQALLTVTVAKPVKDAQESKLALAIGTGWTLGFLSDFSWEGLQRWVVLIDPRICQLFKTTPTYLIISKRKALTEGLQTWLYGYVEANTCAYAVPLATMYHASGSTAEPNEFARQLREAIPKLVKIGALRDCSTVKNGKVALFKVPSARPKNLAKND